MSHARSLALLVGLLVAVAPAHAELDFGDAQCRRGLAFGVRRLAGHIVRQLEHCHLQRVRGLIPSNTDCNSLLNLPFPKVITRIETSLAQLAKTQCRKASPPAALGFNTCPSPCEGIPVSTYQEVAECLVCTTRAQANHAVALALGSPPVTGPYSAVARCVDAVSKALRQTLMRRIEQERRCQFLVDRARLTPATDCRTTDLTGIIARAVERSDNYLARCRREVRRQVGGCGNVDLAAMQQCFNQAVRQRSVQLLTRVYDPFVEPTP